jgi:hypothetical protein
MLAIASGGRDEAHTPPHAPLPSPRRSISPLLARVVPARSSKANGNKTQKPYHQKPGRSQATCAGSRANGGLDLISHASRFPPSPARCKSRWQIVSRPWFIARCPAGPRAPRLLACGKGRSSGFGPFVSNHRSSAVELFGDVGRQDAFSEASWTAVAAYLGGGM